MSNTKIAEAERSSNIWHRFSLRAKIYLIVSALIIIPFFEGVVMIWYTFKMDKMLTTIIEKDLAALQVAEGLETALVNQRGFVTYYFLDGDTDWLRQLGEYRRIFKEKLEYAAALAD
ncbi:MAG: hypothetical protein R6U27_13140, partial [Desulfobacterales bacterium]